MSAQRCSSSRSSVKAHDSGVSSCQLLTALGVPLDDANALTNPRSFQNHTNQVPHIDVPSSRPSKTDTKLLVDKLDMSRHKNPENWLERWFFNTVAPGYQHVAATDKRMAELKVRDGSELEVIGAGKEQPAISRN